MRVESRENNVNNLWKVLLRVLGLNVTPLVTIVDTETPQSFLFSRRTAVGKTADRRFQMPHLWIH
jgi:hypothetical protein